MSGVRIPAPPPSSGPRRPRPGARPRPVLLYRIARAALLDSCRLPRGTTLVVACSGGPDSLALLHVLTELARPFGLSLVVAHLDHGLRGRAAREDARFVARHAARLGWPAVVERIDAAAWMAAHDTSGEDGLRRLRRAFLARVARAHGATAVALGHTADDQAETVLLRLVRGTGLRGLAAMRARSGRLIRPLLAARRADVLAYLAARRLRPRQDATNRDPSLRRNFIRHEILPRLAHLNPQVAPALAALSERAAALDDWLQREAGQALEACRTGAARGGICLVGRRVLGYHPVVREALYSMAYRHLAGADAGLTRRHLDAIAALVERGREGASVDLPGSLLARRMRGRVCFGPATRAGARRRAPRPGG